MKEWITGKNPVYETLLAGKRHFFRLLIASEIQPDRRIRLIEELGRKKNISIEKVPRNKINNLGENTQGIALEASGYVYHDLSDVISLATERKEPPFILILDTLQNPQNLATLIRSAEAFGVHGILLPFRHTVGVTPAVVTASAGASEHMLIAMMNLAQAIHELQQMGVWVLGLEGSEEAVPIEQVKLTGGLALVVGSEGDGMRSLIKKSCDQLIRLSMVGRTESLNAAVAGSIALYLAFQQRGFPRENL
jgi:23S rRNA (guanosine2251-2'-O)-methyltransferase